MNTKPFLALSVLAALCGLSVFSCASSQTDAQSSKVSLSLEVKDAGLDYPVEVPVFDLEDLVPPGEEIYNADPSEALLFGPELLDDSENGKAYIQGFGSADDAVTWNFIVSETRFYKIYIEMNFGGEKKDSQADLYLDGRLIASIKSNGSSDYIVFEVPDAFIGDGPHELTLWHGWKKLQIGKVRIVSGDSFMKYKPSAEPVNPKASKEVRAIMQFFTNIWGKYMISGQMDVAWNKNLDMLKKVREITGREPGLMGYDFLDLNYRTGRSDQVKEAIDYWNKGGLVAFCWHWRAGDSQEFYTDKTNFRINKDPNSEEYKFLIKTIDIVAKELQRLQDAGVPVLWRPLHEASGGWFWWGASGAQDYIWLWNLMYDRLVNVHGLNNLIWVWNGQDAAWYPGNDTVDIIGMDIYAKPGDYSSHLDQFFQALSWAQGGLKMLALTENGTMVDPDNLIKDGVPWLWFMTWNDGPGKVDTENFLSSNYWTSEEMKKKIYNHPYVLTLDELPSFKE